MASDFALAKSHIDRGETDTAFAILIGLYAKKFMPAVLWLGRYYRDKGDDSKAEYLFKEAIDEDKAAAVDLANMYCERMEYGLAIKVLRDNSTNVKCKIALGRIFEDSANYNEAIKWYKDAIDHGSKSFIELGSIHYKLGNYDEAIKFYTMEIEEGYDKETALIWMGDAHIRNGNNKLGCESFEKALSYGTEAAGSLVEYWTNIEPNKIKANYYSKIENRRGLGMVKVM